MITPLRGVDDWTFVFSSEKIFVHARLCMKIESTPAPLPTLSSPFQDQEARTQSIVLAELIPYRLAQEQEAIFVYRTPECELLHFCLHFFR